MMPMTIVVARARSKTTNFDRAPDEDRVVGGDGDRHVLGQRGVELVDRGPDAGGNLEDIGLRLADDAEADAGLAVHAERRAAFRRAEHDVGDIADPGGRVDLDRRDLLGRLGAGVGADEERLGLVGDLAGGRVERDVAESAGQVVDGEAARGERVGIDDDADQRLAVAADLDVGDALDCGEAVDDLVVDELR